MGLGDLFKNQNAPNIPNISVPSYSQKLNTGLSGMFNSPQDNSTQSLDKVVKQTDNMRTRIAAAGQEDKIKKPKQFSITKLLGALAAPGYAANAMIREFTNPDEGHTPGELDPFKAFWRGLTGQEKPSGGDLMRDLGVENQFLANSMGFVFDIFNPLDLLNWVTFGVGKAVTTGGVKGTQALATAFGDDVAEALVKVLGQSADNIGAKSVGEISKQVLNIAKNQGLDNVDDLAKLMTEGMIKTHSTLTTKIPYKEIQRLTLGLETPLGMGQTPIGQAMEIPGTEFITGPVKAAGDAFMGTRVGDKLGKMFSTKYKPKEVPDSVVLRSIQEKGVKAVDQVNDLVGQNIIKETIPEIIDNSIDIGPEVNKAVQRVVELNEVEGARVYEEFRQGINQLFEQTPKKEEEFFKQVERLFKGTTPEDRQLVLNAVLDNKIDLPEHLLPVADGFKAWRESLIKSYKDLGIPVNELENYVPFIPTRSLKPEERMGLKSLFGTVEGKNFDVDEDILEIIRHLDPNLKGRTTNAVDPRAVNAVLDKPWLSEDPAHMMMVRGTRAVKTQEVAEFMNNFLEQYGLTQADLVKLKNMPKGYAFYENVADATGARMLKQVTKLSTDNAKNIVAIPEEFASVFNEYMELFYNKDSNNAVLRMYDKATGIWKKFAYLYNPGHIPRDTTGNIWQGYLMGMRNPKYYKYSADSMKAIPEIMEALEPLLKDVDISNIDNVIKVYQQAVKEGKISPTVINMGKKSVDVFEAFQKAQKYGALETAAAMAETPKTIKQALNIAEGKKLSTAVGKYEDVMRKWTESTNNWTRFAGYLHQLDNGKSFTGAAAQVKKFYFDYFDLTPFERKVMRRIIPFYTWTRKNIPMELAALASRPKDFAWVQKGIDAIAGENRDEPMPDWAQDTGLIKLGNTGKYINPNLPYQDLGRIPFNRDNFANLLASVNPLIRGPVEMATNTEMYSGKPIERYAGDEQDLPIVGALMRLLGMEDVPQVDKRGLGYVLNQLPMLRNVDTVLNPENSRQMSRLGTMIGLPSYFDAEQLQRSEIYEENARLNELIRLLKDRGIEIPTMEEINSDPREELLKRLGIDIRR